jgi:hypothetical protein
MAQLFSISLTATAYNKQNTDAPTFIEDYLWSLNAVAHTLGLRRPPRENGSFIAAVVASFLSSQQHCGVLLNVMRNGS